MKYILEVVIKKVLMSLEMYAAMCSKKLIFVSSLPPSSYLLMLGWEIEMYGKWN